MMTKKLNQFVNEALVEIFDISTTMDIDEYTAKLYEMVQFKLEVYLAHKQLEPLMIEDPNPMQFAREMMAAKRSNTGQKKSDMRKVKLHLARRAYQMTFDTDRCGL